MENWLLFFSVLNRATPFSSTEKLFLYEATELNKYALNWLVVQINFLI